MTTPDIADHLEFFGMVIGWLVLGFGLAAGVCMAIAYSDRRWKPKKERERD